MIQISLQACKIQAPNCSGGDQITAVFTVEDASGNTGTATLVGTLNAVNAISDTVFLALNGVDGASALNTVMGSISVTEAYQAGYDVDENISVSLHVTDCKGWENIEDFVGYTNAVMNNQNQYIENHEGEWVCFIN